MKLSDDAKIGAWRLSLAGISVFNIAAWFWASGAAGDAYGRREWLLSGVFTAVCAYRSFLPRVDLERFVLVDTRLSSVFLGRTAATFAEVSFAAQVALALHRIGAQTGLPAITAWSLCVVPLLALAQVFCWYSVATLNHGGHAIEESLWTFTHGVSGLCCALAYSRAPAALKPPLAVAAVLSAGFVGFMSTVDVPMYVRRWRAANPETYLPFGKGLLDSWSRRVYTRRWEDWKEEIAWLTLYFSFAVWVSQAMIRLPR